MMFSYKDHKPNRFPDGGVFLAVATISLDKTELEWYTPKVWFPAFRRISRAISSGNCMDPQKSGNNGKLVEQLLGIDEGSINWRLSINYEYNDSDPPEQSDIPTHYNRVMTLPNDVINDEFYERYQNNRWATCHVVDRQIVSVCHSYNRAITIETRPEYRRKGYGKACLLRITKELMADRLHPGYGTEYANVASRKTAESAGFDQVRLQYWVEVPADRSAALPEEVRNVISHYNSA